MQCDCFLMENDVFLVYMYYTHPSYQTSIVGKNCAYYIRIFTASEIVRNKVTSFMSNYVLHSMSNIANVIQTKQLRLLKMDIG